MASMGLESAIGRDAERKDSSEELQSSFENTIKETVRAKTNNTQFCVEPTELRITMENTR